MVFFKINEKCNNYLLDVKQYVVMNVSFTVTQIETFTFMWRSLQLEIRKEFSMKQLIEFSLKVFTDFNEFSDKKNITLKRFLYSNQLSPV